MKHKTKTGIKRVISAFINSYNGLKFVFKNEEAFRQEIVLCAILLPISFIIGSSTTEILLLISGIFTIIAAELVNTAIETIIDRISLEHHGLSKASKDIGSLIVLLSIIYCIIVWVGVLFFA